MQQIINGDTTDYLYDAANRLEQLNGQPVYTFDPNGNLLESDVLTNTFDAANRLVETERAGSVLEPVYNGVNDRVGQIKDGVQTDFALDVAVGLPEVIYTGEGNAYLHLPGVIVAESSSGEMRYLLADGLGSVRQAVDETGAVVSYHEFDPYGNPVQGGGEPFGYTGEWWEAEVGLLHLRARWYAPETGTFLSRDPWEGDDLQSQTLNGWSYVEGNPINWIDPLGLFSIPDYNQWVTARGVPGEQIRAEVPEQIYKFAIRKVIENREHIIGAAFRHKFIDPTFINSICNAPAHQLQKLYLLAGIIYQESVGLYFEVNGLDDSGQPGTWEDYANVQIALNYAGNTSVGIAQVKFFTALEAEHADLVYDPYKSTPGNPVKATMLPSSFNEIFEAATMSITRRRTARLIDDAWSVEYAAAHLHRGSQQEAFSQTWPAPTGGNIIMSPKNWTTS